MSNASRKSVVAWTAIAFLAGIAVASIVPRMRQGAPQEARKPVEATAQHDDTVRLPPDSTQLDQIRSTPAELSDVPLVEPLPARFAYDESRTARVSSPVSGRILQLRAQVNDRVAVGQPLATIDSPDYAAAVADMEKAKADADRKAAAAKRSKELFEAGLLSRRDLESAEADDAQATAELRRARERLDNLRARGTGAQRFELASPIAGVVVDRKANPGMEVRPDLQDPLFVVSDLGRLWALIDVPEHSLTAIAAGSSVSFEVAAFPRHAFTGRIDLVSPVLDATTRRVQARVSVDNGERLLRPEMYAKATISTAGGPKALRVPISALITGGERNFVFVEQSRGVFRRQAIELAAQNRESAYVIRGIEVGDRVVSAGAILLASEFANR